MQNVALVGQITSVDAQVDAAQVVLNVDLRSESLSGGSFTAEIASGDATSGTTVIPAVVSVVDLESSMAVLDVDFRAQAAAGGFMNAVADSALLKYAGAAAPIAPTTGSATSGALDGATYKAKVTYVDANGNESLASDETSQVVASSHVLTVTSPSASSKALKWNVYVTDGLTNTEVLQNASPINLGTDWQEPDSGLIAGRAVPTANALVSGPCTVTVHQGAGPPTQFAPGVCTITIAQ